MLNFEDASRYLTEDTPEEVREFISTAIEWKKEHKKSIKQQLLWDAGRNDPQYCIGFGAWTNVATADVEFPEPDNDDDGFCSFGKWELTGSWNLRTVTVQISPTAKPVDVLRLLKKIRLEIKRNPNLITGRSERNEILKSATYRF